jgi:4,5-DOPA dioxygenase extradiol
MAAFADFDAWTARAIREGDLAALSNYEREAPGVDTVLPTREHFTPLFVALGAASDLESAEFPTAGFWYGNSMRSVELR